MDSGQDDGAGGSSSGRHNDTSYQRRREQVRRAQRMHRDRKAAYVTALEHEVADLRAENAAFRSGDAEYTKVKNLEREVAQLRAERAEHLADSAFIRKLQAFLKLHTLELPPELRLDHAHPHMAVAEFTGDTCDDEAIHVRMPRHEQQSGELVFASNASYCLPQNGNASSDHSTIYSGSQSNGRGTTPVSASSQLVCEDGSNGTQAGVDFVLALERICLHHHKMTMPELIRFGDLGTGHLDMLSSPIMARVPPSATANPRNIPLSPGIQWSVPAAELERLLSLSHSLSLGAEATPVQIWQRVYLHPQFCELTVDRLDQLKCALLPQVDCCGFGAVIAEAHIEAVWKTIFAD